MKEFVDNIEKLTEKNEHFRHVIFTGPKSQLVLMTLKPGEDIGEETHDDLDQFFRIEEGEAKFIFNKREEHVLKSGGGVVVPAGTTHNVVNNLKTRPLKLYTVYSKPHHPDGEIQKTKEEAEMAEKKM
ncbi:MAG: cupin domain-containing protein [Anaerolineaceae bacterium]